jgi:serine/threonine protein kinase
MSLENQYQQTLKTKQCPSCGSFVDPSLTVCPKDGTSLVERFDKDPAFVNYEFLGTIGTGGMGVIYKARQVILNKLVAIKTLHPHLSSPAAFRRFQMEGQTTSLLKHPFIVSVHDFGMTKSGQTFMVMDFVDGETLDSLLRKIGQLDEEHFLNIFIDVCDALAHAHSRSVVHRDIKSSNIMIVKGDSGKEEIRILDFGIAKLVSDTEGSASQVTRTGEIIGTATCMSPEQARGGKVDHRSDLYALGCVMYESLATSPPFVGNTPLETMLMHLEKKPLTIKEASMGHAVDPRIEKIIFCLLEKDPEHRYQSMIDLKHDLESLRNSKFSGAKAAEFRMPKKDEQSEKKSWRVPVIAGGVSIVLLAAVGVGVLLFKAQLVTMNKQVPALQAEGANDRNPGKAPVVTIDGQDNRTPTSTVLDIDGIPSTTAGYNIVKPGLEAQLARNEARIKSQAIDAGLVVDIVNDDLTAFKGKHPTTIGVNLIDAKKVTDEGLKNLRDLHLTDLDLKNCGATDLDWIFSQTDLQHLNIACTKITPRAFQNIGKLKELQYLNISRTPFRDSDIKSIKGLVKRAKFLSLVTINYSIRFPIL